VSRFVLDVSVTMAWHFEDEATPPIWQLLDRLIDDGAVVPGLWPLEVANVLAAGERRGRSTPAKIGGFIEQLAHLPLAVDGETSKRALSEILALARGQKLTAYDASYLELAIRLGLPLATVDRELRAAAAALGVAVLPA
jgi:predicted nucleic acid-binding protein